jgi:hypothetical protein
VVSVGCSADDQRGRVIVDCGLLKAAAANSSQPWDPKCFDSEQKPLRLKLTALMLGRETRVAMTDGKAAIPKWNSAAARWKGAR